MGKVKMTAGAASAEGVCEIHFIPSGKLTRHFTPHIGIGTGGGGETEPGFAVPGSPPG